MGGGAAAASLKDELTETEWRFVMQQRLIQILANVRCPPAPPTAGAPTPTAAPNLPRLGGGPGHQRCRLAGD